MPDLAFYEQLDDRLRSAEREAVEAVREFARSRVAPLARTSAARGTLPREILRGYAALGMTGLQTPRSLGGMDASYYAKVRAAQEIARFSFACAFSLNNLQGFTTRIARYGTPSQRERYLRGLLSGDLAGAYALTEPEVGSDLSAIQTRATRVDGGWVLNGEKAWIANSHLVDVILVLAQTGSGARGIGGFLVPLSAAGAQRMAPYDVAAGQLLGAGGVALRDCLVPDDDVLHAPGDAFKVALQHINGARIHVAAMCVAMLEAALSQAVAYCSRRVAFGRTLLSHQGLRWQLSDVATDLEAAHQLVVRGAELVHSEQDATLSAAHAKKFAVTAAIRGIEACIQAMGAQGTLDRYGLMRQLGEAKLAAYADGTTEMQTERIGQLLMDRYGPGAQFLDFTKGDPP
jgi:acrylyl-CoA reductase (NADPH)